MFNVLLCLIQIKNDDIGNAEPCELFITYLLYIFSSWWSGTTVNILNPIRFVSWNLQQTHLKRKPSFFPTKSKRLSRRSLRRQSTWIQQQEDWSFSSGRRGNFPVYPKFFFFLRYSLFMSGRSGIRSLLVPPLSNPLIARWTESFVFTHKNRTHRRRT